MDLDATYGIVLAGEGWHPGVIGIVASRIVEQFGRPTILIALDGDEGKGSGRSIAPFDLHAGIGRCRDLLLRFGGHRSAAGVTIARDRVAEFAARFNEAARAALTPDDLVPEIRADLELPVRRRHRAARVAARGTWSRAASGIRRPCSSRAGSALAAPPRIVGKDGLRLVLQGGGHTLEAIGWGMAGAQGRTRPRAVRSTSRSGWTATSGTGESRLQARLADFRAETVRIVAGKWRGRRIKAPDDDRVRPTADRVREAWMSIVSPWLPEARVLDLYAGSGALGLEALSRGAAVADFVEISPASLRCIGENVTTLGAGDAAVVHRTDALRFARALAAARVRHRVRRSALRAGIWPRGSPRLAGGSVRRHPRRRAPHGRDAARPAGTRRVYGDTVVTIFRAD